VTLLEQFDSLFDLTPDRLLGAHGYGTVRAFVPPADLYVTDDEVTVVMDVPGFKADELEIELIGDTLTVRGARAYPQLGEEQKRSWYRFERGYGKFQRMLQVPKGLDPDAVTASMADGVLTLHIPQPESRKPRRIEIGTDATPAAITEHTNGNQPALAGAAA
jgi:HSP20 family protein